MGCRTAQMPLLCLFLVASPAAAALLHSSERRGKLTEGAAADASANPIRKVVTMLQSMQKKVESEGAKSKELYDSFMCYCKTSGATLGAGITAAETKIPAVGSSIKEAEAQKVGAEADLKQAQTDRSAAKATLAEAGALRSKEYATFKAEEAVYETNLAALSKATKAIENGMFGSFVQTTAAQAVRKIALDSQNLENQDRRDILAFFSAQRNSDDAPSTGDIVGILKQMGDTMAASLKETTATETAAVKTYESLVSSKEKEVDVLTETIETKMVQIGELGITIVQMKQDLTDTEAALLEDQKFLADMKKSCSTKTDEYNAEAKTRGDELTAIAETIKVLNDDDALELFKKTLPGAGSSLIQIGRSNAKLRARALASLQAAMKQSSPISRHHMDLISLALRGKTIGFEKVISMIDEMVGTLKKEQEDDDHKKEYCAAQFDFAEDKKKSLERKISTEETAIANAEEGIATLKEDIAALEDGIKALDKEVAKAAEQRKEEHEAYSEMMASDSAAKELLLFAKNRLNKFYNPKLYAPPEKRELSEEDRVVVSMGGTLAPTNFPGGIAGTGISLAQVRMQRGDNVETPPEAPAAYVQQTKESAGVIALLDLLVKDLDTELTTAETEEKDSHADYETFMKDSAEKRAQDAATLTEKELTKADLESALEGHKDSKSGAEKELMGTEGYISSLHAECDWLIKYFDVRKTARDEEIGALSNAKAVLSGADYSA